MNLFKPHMNVERILADLRPVLESGWIGLGPKTEEFEAALAEYWDVKPRQVCTTNSCSEALRLAIQSLQLKPWDQVLTTPITFVSTNHAILWNRLQPVFCDVEPTTGNLDVESVAMALEKHDNIQAIVVVHVGGYPANMPEINALAKKHGCVVVEDCAHAMGAYYDERHRVGNSDNICCFSFHAVKNLPMGDGGAIVSTQPEWFKQARWLGIDKSTSARTSKSGYSWEYNVGMVGSKAHTNDIMATIGLAQLEYLDADNKRRRQIVGKYEAELKGVAFPAYQGPRQSSYHFYPVFVENREAVCALLKAKGIHFGMHYAPNNTYKMYLNYYDQDLPNSRWYADHEITLPIYPEMTDEDVDLVVSTMNKVAA